MRVPVDEGVDVRVDVGVTGGVFVRVGVCGGVRVMLAVCTGGRDAAGAGERERQWGQLRKVRAGGTRADGAAQRTAANAGAPDT